MEARESDDLPGLSLATSYGINYKDFLAMDDVDIMESIRGRQEMEARLFKEFGYWMAWFLTHIYNQNPHLKKGTKVKIGDLIKLDKPETGETEKEALERMEKVFAKRDAIKKKNALKKLNNGNNR